MTHKLFAIVTLVVLGAALAIFLIALQRLYALIWLGAGASVFLLLRLAHVHIHPLLWVGVYLVLTLLAGIGFLLKQVGREIPIC